MRRGLNRSRPKDRGKGERPYFHAGGVDECVQQLVKTITVLPIGGSREGGLRKTVPWRDPLASHVLTWDIAVDRTGSTAKDGRAARVTCTL
jgi:hypothetical protein